MYLFVFICSKAFKLGRVVEKDPLGAVRGIVVGVSITALFFAFLILLIRSCDAASLLLLEEANATVNRTIQYRPDTPGADFWGVQVDSDGRRFGDCEDYVLEKMAWLMARGEKAESMQMALFPLVSGVWHAVLLVPSPDGVRVLDNRSWQTYRWAPADYGKPHILNSTAIEVVRAAKNSQAQKSIWAP